MNYSDPNFNVIVCGPGRTGSVFITSIFTTVTKLTPYQRLHNHNQEPMKAQECLHSHDIEDIKLMNEHTFFIASKRNMIDSTFSHQIAKSQDVWRYYERRPGTIKPFEVSIESFLNQYDHTKNFYIKLKNIMPANSLVIDYDAFGNDTVRLFEILKLSKLNLKFLTKHVKYNSYPIKTPGTHKDWVLNYDEVLEAVKHLDPNPCI